MSKLHLVCAVEELPPGQRKIIDAGGLSIGVFNVHGEYFALRNVCPHQLAPLCEGRITGTNAPGEVGEFNWIKDGEIIRCPWHAWEFEIMTGRSVFNPHRLKVGTYRVKVLSDSAEVIELEVGADSPDPGIETFPVTSQNGAIFVEA